MGEPNMSSFAEAIEKDVQARVAKIEGEFSRELQTQLAASRERLEKSIRQNLIIAASLLLTILAATLIVGYTRAQHQVQDRVYSLNADLISLQKDLLAAQAKLQGADALLEEATTKAGSASTVLDTALASVESGYSRITDIEAQANAILSRLKEAEDAAEQR